LLNQILEMDLGVFGLGGLGGFCEMIWEKIFVSFFLFFYSFFFFFFSYFLKMFPSGKG